MEEEMVSLFLLRNGNFFHKNDIKEVERIVSKVNQDFIASLSVLSFRNPLFMSILSFFLGMFGVDRFLLGDIKRGALKALILPIQFIGAFFVFKAFAQQTYNVFFIEDVSFGEQINSFYLTIAIVLLLISVLLSIYYIIDIFLIYYDTCKYNYRILVDFAAEATMKKATRNKESEEVDDEGFYTDVTPASSSFSKSLSKSARTIKRRKSSEKSVVDSENKSKDVKGRK